MTTERLREVHQARPFAPFRIHLADGRQLEVVHPEMMAYAPNARTAIVVKADESHEVIDLLLVTSLEVSRGKPKNRKLH